MYAKIAIAIITAVTMFLNVKGIITAEESSNLVTTGSSAAVSLGTFIAVIVNMVRSRKGKPPLPETDQPVQLGQ